MNVALLYGQNPGEAYLAFVQARVGINPLLKLALILTCSHVLQFSIA